MDGTEPSEPFYSTRAQGPRRNNYVSFAVDPDFKAGPLWVWENSLNEQVRHSPLIDGQKNVYITTSSRVRKFTPDGHLQWTYQTNPELGIMVASPSLYKGQVVCVAVSPVNAPTALSLSMADGSVTWQRKYDSLIHNADASSTSVFDDVLFFGTKSSKFQSGHDTVTAINVANGHHLWDYHIGETVWNFSPSTAGDRTLTFSSTCGVAYRISFEGKLIWRSAGSGKLMGDVTCTPSGGTLGPNGLFYAEFSPVDDDLNAGVISAFNNSDGSLVWEYQMFWRGGQYPAIGPMGRDGRLTLVAGVGHNPSPVVSLSEEAQMLAPLGGALRNSVLALDAATGELLWSYQEDPWPHIAGEGEREMLRKHMDNPSWPSEGNCWPDAQAIPLLSGNGEVFMASSHGGWLHKIKDANGDGHIDSAQEVETFNTGYCFLNSPSVAPGMMVVAPCWGNVYIFKS